MWVRVRSHRLGRRVPLLAVLGLSSAFIVACGGDSTSPKVTDVSGNWTYNATNISGSGISCSITGVGLTLTQSGTTFSGSTQGGLLSCTAVGQTSSQALSGDVVANGINNGGSVQFDIGTQDVHNVGTLSGNSMSGTVTVTVSVSGSTLVLVGNFAAVKQ